MSEALLSLAILACPVGMGLMMWFMMRGGKKDQTAEQDRTGSATDSEIARLRAELDQVRTAQREAAPNKENPADR